MDRAPVVGIHFNDLRISAGVYANCSYEQLWTEPSYVAFTETAYLTGHEAFEANSAHKFYGLSTNIGQSMNDLNIHNSFKNWKLLLTSLEDNLYFAQVRMERNKRFQIYPLEYVTSLLLGEVFKKIQPKFRSRVTDCVIIVPDTFLDIQKPVLRSACKKARVNAVHICHESTASVVGFTSLQATVAKDNIFVFDATTTPFSAFLYSYENGACVVKSKVVQEITMQGDYRQFLFYYFKDAIEKEYDIVFGRNRSLRDKLITAITCTEWTVNVFRISFEHDSQLYASEIAYYYFEKYHLLKEISGLVNTTLRQAVVYRRDVAEVHMVGDWTRMYNHFMLRLLKDSFRKKLVTFKHEADQSCIGRGAAYLASLLDRNRKNSTSLLWNLDLGLGQFDYVPKPKPFHEMRETYKVGAAEVNVVQISKELAGTTNGDKIADCTSNHWKGLVLVVNNIDFTDRGFNIDGIKIDTERLYTLFTKLGYKVVCCENLFREQLMQVVTMFGMDSRHAGSGHCFVIVLSHGGSIHCDDYFITSEGSEMHPNAVVKLLDSEHCPTLKEMSKIFIFDACRAPNSFTLDDELDIGILRVVQFDDALVVRSKKLASDAFFDSLHGSLFINIMCSLFQKYSAHIPCAELFVKIDKLMSKRCPPKNESVDEICSIG